MTDSLGVWLRRSRETRQLDLDDAARTLRIRRRYLQALEMGIMRLSPVRSKHAILRNYVRFLGCPSKTRLRAMMRRRGNPGGSLPRHGRQPAPRGADVAALSRTRADVGAASSID